MRTRLLVLVVGMIVVPAGWTGRSDEPAAKAAFPRFRMQEIETGLKVGYAVLLVDLNADSKLDIVVVDSARVVWYENPTWKRRTVIEGQTKPDNVCIAAHDIDGDGKLDLALGADWRPSDTKNSGSLQWLKRSKSLDEPWTLYPIDTEPTIHRIRFADLDGDGKPELINVPLHGRNCTAKNNWTDGSPVRVLAYKIPKDPTRDRWAPEVLDQSLYVVHNFYPIPAASGKGMDILCASYEGVSLLTRDAAGKWSSRHVGAGNQSNPKSNRGASEVKMGLASPGRKPGEERKYIATIEPWHGNQVVVYTPPADPVQKLWDRHVIDEQLRWGHGVWCADLDGDGDEELIIGVRDDPAKQDPFKERRGVRIYKPTDGKGAKWVRHIIDDGGVAVEDLAAADLNGDGRTDIVAAGRFTHNVRIYWNEGK